MKPLRQNIAFWACALAFVLLQAQHATTYSWDPIVFHLNAKSMCGNGTYFEWLRTPLPPAIDCLLGLPENAILLTRILYSLLFIAAIGLVYQRENQKHALDPWVYFGLTLLVPALLFASEKGSDLLALSLLLLGLLLEKPWQKGLAFGLATLSRYNYLAFAPVLLLQKKTTLRDALVILAIAALTWTPWLHYNLEQTGDPLHSPSDFVYLNIQQRTIIPMPNATESLLIALFIAAYAIHTLTRPKTPTTEKSLLQRAHDFLPERDDAFTWTALIGLALFLPVGVKEPRYLLMLLPAAAILLARMAHQKAHAKNPIRTGVGLVCALSLLVFLIVPTPNTPAIPNEPALRECRVMTDQWIAFHNAGIVAEPAPGKNDYTTLMQNGTYLVLYDKTANANADFGTFEKTETPNYLLIRPNTCTPQPKRFELNVWRGDWQKANN